MSTYKGKNITLSYYNRKKHRYSCNFTERNNNNLGIEPDQTKIIYTGNLGLIGFAFSNGSTRFSMPAKDTSYTKWSRTYDYMKHNCDKS